MLIDITQRLKEILTYSGLSIRAFSIKCGISQPTLDKQLKGLRSVSLDTVLSICATYPEVSRDWILFGEGEMIKVDTNSRDIERISNLVDTISMLQDALKAKSQTIVALTERIKQLESQISK